MERMPDNQIQLFGGAPNELVEMVCLYLSTLDLEMFRRTCKRVYNVIYAAPLLRVKLRKCICRWWRTVCPLHDEMYQNLYWDLIEWSGRYSSFATSQYFVTIAKRAASGCNLVVMRRALRHYTYRLEEFCEAAANGHIGVMEIIMKADPKILRENEHRAWLSAVRGGREVMEYMFETVPRRHWYFHKDAHQVAAARGDYEYLMWLYRVGHTAFNGVTLSYIFDRGNMDLADWYYSFLDQKDVIRDSLLVSKLYGAAIIRGSVQMLQWLVSHGIAMPLDVVYLAEKYSTPEIIPSLVDLGALIPPAFQIV